MKIYVSWCSSLFAGISNLNGFSLAVTIVIAIDITVIQKEIANKISFSST